MNGRQFGPYNSNNRGSQFDDLFVEVLACESLGTRSLATFVRTEDISIVLDPGLSHGVRDRLPHPREQTALRRCGDRILRRAAEAELLSISHYHFDHYMPTFSHWMNYGGPEASDELYRGKTILLKSRDRAIDTVQSKRAGYIFNRDDCIKHSADGTTYRYGKTSVIFSEPVPHGIANTNLGSVLITTIKTSQTTLVFAPDVQGPMVTTTLNYILQQAPDLVIIGGPPTYLEGMVPSKCIRQGLDNLQALVQETDQTIVDHHLLRDDNWKTYFKTLRQKGRENGNRVLTGAEFVGSSIQDLEASRMELWAQSPPDSNWTNKLKSR